MVKNSSDKNQTDIHVPSGKSKADSHSLNGILKQKRRKVFKPILSNPYTRRNEWPELEYNVMHNIVDLLADDVLRATGNYNKLSSQEKAKSAIRKPEEADYISFGFNSTMKMMERQIASIRKGKFDQSDPNSLSYVFVCKFDMTSSLLYMHFPVMCCLAKVKLIQLPKGSSAKLKSVLGVHESVDILVLKRKAVEEYSSLRNLIDNNVKDIEIGFLNGKESELGLNVQFLHVQQPIKTKINSKKKQQQKKNANRKVSKLIPQ
ncbi:hypothetical protein BRETT_003713 [Brettanomyces bruxellensis]|uniref:Uncharacterized protein n=1 Tax=Dekkera bruxellensis TaxID=5007 RepID=A0A871R455_DEKBR|nr:uncharacterized protein BRETT_003713 [Brettanomyces bruxellensis]QOU19564.1 hypothetical protein BRETT_003713 [Brettanomyces bruxellensis]